MIDFSNIPNLVKEMKPHFFGNLNAPKEHFPTIQEIHNWMDFLDDGDIHLKPGVRIFEMHRLQNYDFCPIVLKDLRAALGAYPEMKDRNIVCFLPHDRFVDGYNWHDDKFHLVSINLVGDTTWYFRDGSEQRMTPGDCMLIPEGLEHTVKGEDIRFTASLCAIPPRKK